MHDLQNLGKGDKLSDSSVNHTTTTSGISIDLDEEMELWEGYEVSKHGYVKLRNVQTMVQNAHSNWANAALHCAYGENAKMYRLKPTSQSGNLTFHSKFLDFAKIEYRKWLQQHKFPGTEDDFYSPAEIESEVSTLPAYLSRKAEDLNGPRGIHKRIREVVQKGEDPSALRKEYEENKAARAAAAAAAATAAAEAGLPAKRPRKRYTPKGKKASVLTAPATVEQIRTAAIQMQVPIGGPSTSFGGAANLYNLQPARSIGTPNLGSRLYEAIHTAHNLDTVDHQ